MMSGIEIRSTSLVDVYVAESPSVRDHRGSFARQFCERTLKNILGSRRIVQINHSYTTAVGAIRGLHYQQPPHDEMKLVRCIKGRVWDVAVDLRAGSPTFLKWHAEELAPENNRMLVVPEGCAHGFQVLEPDSELMYLVTAAYAPGAEGGARWNDPACSIDWPLEPTELSDKDRGWPLLPDNFVGIPIVHNNAPSMTSHSN